MNFLQKIVQECENLKENESISDFYVRADEKILCKKNQILQDFSDFANDNEIFDFISQNLSKGAYENLIKYRQEQDFSLAFLTFSCRFHAFFSENKISLNIRVLPKILPKLDARYDYFVQNFFKNPGLLLISGATGSGKTTTANCLLDTLNAHHRLHIICIEDPIEYRHENRNCFFTYRALGMDTQSFDSGIISAMRQDPDVIFVGELRDSKAIRSALLAAQTGHIVIASIHGSDVVNTIFRFMAAFEDRDLAAFELSQSLFGIINQKRDANKRIICEMMTTTSAVKNLIKERKFHQIAAQIGLSRDFGMLNFSDPRNS